MTTPSSKTARKLDAALFAATSAPVVPVTTQGRGSRPLARVLRIVRDLVIGLCVVASIPLTTIGMSDHAWGWNAEGMRARLVEVEHFRPLSAPIDATISPEAAGAAMRRLLPLAATPAFPLPPEYHNAEPWNVSALADVFSIVRSGEWNGPTPAMAMSYAAPKGHWAAKTMSESERAWFKTVASSPIWKDFDIVARAPRVDMLAQRFQVPFRSDEWPGPMPIPSFIEARILAFAGVSRAAHYASIGDHARAEAALRTVVSFGFALLDDGVTTVEGLMGRVVVDAGREAWKQYYWSDPYNQVSPLRSLEPFLEPKETRVSPLGFRQAEGSVATLQSAALLNVADPKLPRSFRFDQLETLALTTCGSVRSVVLGPSADVQHAFDAARQTLAQSEAERQYIDLLEREVSAIPVRPVERSLLLQIVQGAAVITSTVTGNPRIAACTRAVVGDFESRSTQ